MPCDGSIQNEQERIEREEALAELADEIAAGTKTIIRNIITGDVRISGWSGSRAEKSGWCEGCALRSLHSRGGWVAETLKRQGVTEKPFRVSSHRGHVH